MNKLSSFEFMLTWMAVRYAMNGQTIASASLPKEIISNYYHRMSAEQKKSIVNDLKGYLNTQGHFGNKEIDNPIWMTFMNALDEENHFSVEFTNGEIIRCFKANDKLYSIEKYVEAPYRNITINPTFIKRVVDNLDHSSDSNTTTHPFPVLHAEEIEVRDGKKK